MDQSIERYIKNLVREALSGLQLERERQVYIIANWKMNKNLSETAEFFKQIKGSSDVNLLVCPPTPLLYPVHLFMKQKAQLIGLGAQNVHWAEKGAYTGETSTGMLKDIGCEFVIIGHSERRQYAGETDEIVQLKGKKVIEDGLTPVLCIGETLEQKNRLQTEQVLSAQLFEALKDVESNQVIIAYEPIWAIGTGQSATPETVQQTHVYIRSCLKQLMGEKAENISILYGGSVNEVNASEYSHMPDIDGVLVGGASLKAKTFQKIIDVFAKGEQNS
jgi:triosephosphate isomerase